MPSSCRICEKKLICPVTDDYLLRFIRASDYNIERSFQLIKDYFKAKANHPEEFVFGPASDYVKVISRLDLGYVSPANDNDGRKVMLLRLGDIDPGVEDWEELMQSASLILEAYSLDSAIQESGACLIIDCTNFSLKIMKWATPHKLRVIMTFLQVSDPPATEDAIPVKFDAIHIVNAPVVFNVFFTAIKPFMNDNFIQKLQWHKAPYTKMHQYVSPIYLPHWLGGTLELDSVKYWYNDIVNKEHILEEYSKYGYHKKQW